MSVRIDALTKGLARTTALFDYNAPYTLMWWVYGITLDVNTSWQVEAAVAAGDYDAAYWSVGAGAAGVIVTHNGYAEVTSQNGATPLSTNTWYHFALVRTSDTQLLLYLNGQLEATLNHPSIAGRAAQVKTQFGSDWSSTDHLLNGRFAGIKLWPVALGAAEVAQEYSVLRPQRTANLDSWAPVWPGSGERGRDYSGNARDWTEVGTLADEDAPPASYGAPVLVVINPPPTARPISDVSAGGWTVAPLWSKVAEVVPDDTDYIQSSTNPNADQAELAMTALPDPFTNVGHTLSYRIRLVS